MNGAGVAVVARGVAAGEEGSALGRSMGRPRRRGLARSRHGWQNKAACFLPAHKVGAWIQSMKGWDQVAAGARSGSVGHGGGPRSAPPTSTGHGDNGDFRRQARGRISKAVAGHPAERYTLSCLKPNMYEFWQESGRVARPRPRGRRHRSRVDWNHAGAVDYEARRRPARARGRSR